MRQLQQKGRPASLKTRAKEPNTEIGLPSKKGNWEVLSIFLRGCDKPVGTNTRTFADGKASAGSCRRLTYRERNGRQPALATFSSQAGWGVTLEAFASANSSFFYRCIAPAHTITAAADFTVEGSALSTDIVHPRDSEDERSSDKLQQCCLDALHPVCLKLTPSSKIFDRTSRCRTKQFEWRTTLHCFVKAYLYACIRRL